MIRVISAAVALVSLSGVLGAQPSAPRTFSKHVLAWADVRNGYQHESITHALSTIERLGWESGLYDTIIRTDSQSITKSPVLFRQGTGIASGEQFLARNVVVVGFKLLIPLLARHRGSARPQRATALFCSSPSRSSPTS